MRKFTLILTIAVLCSFAAVRRKEEQDGEALFQEAVTQVFKQESMAYQVSDSEEAIGNTNFLFSDQPTYAAQVLNGYFDQVVLWDNGNELSWLALSALPSNSKSKQWPVNFHWN